MLMKNATAWPRTLKDALADNPVLEKDVVTVLRSKLAPAIVALGGIAMLIVLGAVHVAESPHDIDAQGWAALRSAGRPMVAAALGGLLGLTTLLLPALASGSIAGERERGTLSLLQLSALTPLRIVAGKVAAIVLSVAPFAILVLPILALATIYGGVGWLVPLAAVGVLVPYGLGLVAVGVAASAVTPRARSAALLAMLFALAPVLLLGVPAAVALGLFADGDADVVCMVPVLIVGVVATLGVSVAALLVAVSSLAPKSMPRWPARRVVVVALACGLPALAALASRTVALSYSDMQAMIVVLAVMTGFVVAATLIVEICTADTHLADRRTPLGQALLMTVLTAVGLGLAVAASPALPGVSTTTVAWTYIVGVAYVAFGGMVAALTSTLAKARVVRIVATLSVLGGLAALPPVLWDGRDAPYAFASAIFLVARLLERPYADNGDVVGGLVFFALGAALAGAGAAALGRRRRPAAR